MPTAEFTEPETLEVIRNGTYLEKKELSDERLEELLSTSHFAPGSRIMDFGCGTGTLIRKHLIPLAERADVLITGLDISKTMIDYANKHSSHPKVQYICSSPENPPVERNSFDLIVSTFVVDYIPQSQ
jgi:ubiquinone/menaquinone biosynthesis C-methylase UbiE